MRCFINFSLNGFSNAYLIGPDNGGDAIVIDPGEMNLKLLNLVENNNFYIRHVLITHNHKPHTEGIRTLRKIYDADIYSSSEKILGYPTNVTSPGTLLSLSGIDVEVMEFSGKKEKTLVYRIGKMLFTGDTLGAGNLGHEESSDIMEERSKLVSSLIKNMDNNIMVFPGHGPPSTIRAEKEFNPEFH